MAHDDKAKEYPCACGKVFRRQLALERHVDVHHSSRSVSHKCEVCGKTFGSRNTLTMHRTVHGGTQAPTTTTFRSGDQRSPQIKAELNQEDEGLPPGAEAASELDFEGGSDAIQTDIETMGEMEEDEIDDDEDEEAVMTLCKLEVENENPDVTVSRRIGRSVDCGKASDGVQKTTANLAHRRSAMTLSNFHIKAEPRHSDLCSAQSEPSSAGSVLDLFSGQPFSSADLLSGDCGQQSVEFTEMLVEEIVSESLFLQQADHHLSAGGDSNVDWSLSETGAGLESSDRLDESRTKRQPSRVIEITPVDSHPSNRRTKVVRAESARKHQERVRQSRLSDEVDTDMVDDMESLQRESASRQVNSARTPFVCALCHKSFDSEKYLSMHMPLHKPYVETAETRNIPMSAVSNVVTEADVVQLLQVGLPSVGIGAKQKKVLASSTEMQQWTCQYCNKAFMQNSNYKNHMRTHSDERPFVCEICNIGFKERYHLKKHVLFKHTTDLKETCRVCGKCFKDSTAVRAHERIHSELRPYSCNLCGKTFKTSECLWHHENRSKTCGKSALRRNDALAAAAAASGVSLAPQQNEPTPTPTSGRRVRKPRQSAAGGAKTRSPRQSQKTSGFGQSCSSLLKPDSPPMDDEDDEFLRSEVESSVLSIKTEPDCDLFDDQTLQTFLSNEPDFKNILEIFDFDVHKDGSSTEETGSDLTDSDTGLAREIEDFGGLGSVGSGAKCNGSGGLECTKCAKKFSSSVTFEKHMVMHNEERPYRCTLCDNGFKLKVHLKKHHLYRHSDEYPCECSICGKRFKDSSAVRLHERIHSSDRPFRCNCGKGFKTRENLWGHRNRGPCEKTQDFITNNIRLFRSAEFGPILGVPINSGSAIVSSSGLASNHVTAANCSLFDPTGLTVSGLLQQAQQSVQTVLLKTTPPQSTMVSTSHSVQFVPSCVISTSGFSPGQASSRQVKVATLRLIKPRTSGDTATYPTSILPTAIVTPIPREGGTTAQPSSRPDATTHPNSETTLKTAVDSGTPVTRHVPTAKTLQGVSQSLNRNTTLDANSSGNISTPSPTASSSANIFLRTAAADLSKGTSSQSSVADKCPTVQKYLERSSTASIRFLDMNSLVVTPTTTVPSNDQQKPTVVSSYKRQKLNSIGEDNSSTEWEERNGNVVQKQQDMILNCSGSGSEGAFSFTDQESQESGSLPILDPLLPNSPFPACTSMYPDIEDYGDMKYDPSDPTLNIGDMYWGDSDNTLSSGWILENESLFSDLSLTSNFGIL